MFHQLARKGWQTEHHAGGWRLCHPRLTEAVYVNVTARWITLVYPFQGLEHQLQAVADQARTYHSLLEQNEQMFMAKLCLDDDAVPLLTIEIPAQQVQLILLDWALDSFLCYAAAPIEEEDREAEQELRILPKDTYYRPDETPGLPRITVSRYIKGIEMRKWFLKEEPSKTGIVWHLGYKGRFRVFDGYLVITKNWTYFQIPLLRDLVPPVLQEKNVQVQVLFLKYLLQLNALWFMAKLGISKDGCLLLLLEVPTETLDFPFFQLATSSLATYLDRYEQEVQIMAALHHDSQLVALLSERACFD